MESLVVFDKTKKIIDIQITNIWYLKNNNIYLSLIIPMKLYNIKYNYYCYLRNSKYLYNNNDVSYYYNTYDFTLHFYYNKIYKDSYNKERHYNKLPFIMYTYYAYFIYSKYYNSYYRKKYLYNMKSIGLKKLFNCRELYKLIAFI